MQSSVSYLTDAKSRESDGSHHKVVQTRLVVATEQAFCPIAIEFG